MARLKRKVTTSGPNLYEQIRARAHESLARSNATPEWPDDDQVLYPREALQAHDKRILELCAAGEPLPIGRWQVPRHLPIRELSLSFLLHPDGRIELD